MKNLMLAVSMVIILCGCATSYQRSGFSGGFEETQLSENVWQISFEGNGYTSDKRASDFVILRSADLAMMGGFPYFAFADESSSTETGFLAQQSAYGTNFYAISKPTAKRTVVMFKEKPSKGLIYESAFVCNSIGKKYGVACEQLK